MALMRYSGYPCAANLACFHNLLTQLGQFSSGAPRRILFAIVENALNNDYAMVSHKGLQRVESYPDPDAALR